ERIAYLPKKDNWWGPGGQTGPCGPDTEMFYWASSEPAPEKFNPEDKRWVEIWNDVFMQYNKTADGKYELLKQKNVDTGMGVERASVALQGKASIYEIDTFKPIVDRIHKIALTREEKSVRIIADHIRASTFILAEDVEPSNVDRGYILRRLVRRAVRHGKLLGINQAFLGGLAQVVIDIFKKEYPYLEKKKKFILDELKKEEEKFGKTLETGLKKFDQIIEEKRRISGKDAFLLFQSFGFPIEITKDIGAESDVEVDEAGFEEEYKKHQELSRVGAEKKFKGGLSDASEESTKLHTATHMLAEALRQVLGSRDVMQKGSNITPERLRYDFNFDRKLIPDELKKVENLVNKKIKESLPVNREEMTVDEAKKKGAQGVFEHKYVERVSVYSIGNFSVEICGGPHVQNTSELGKFKIVKEESVAAGVRRIKAVLG
ncbi:alanine--tRNA ligase, partial [archaeon]